MDGMVGVAQIEVCATGSRILGGGGEWNPGRSRVFDFAASALMVGLGCGVG